MWCALHTLLLLYQMLRFILVFFNIVVYASGNQCVMSEMLASEMLWDVRLAGCVYVKARCGDGGTCNVCVYGMLSSLKLWRRTRAPSFVYCNS